MADDFSELTSLFRDLTEVPNLSNREVKKSVQQTAMQTKKSWAADAKKGPRGRQYGATIDYEVRQFGAFGQGVFEAEVGPDLARYGGKTGKGGLVPSLGILDDPNGGISATPSRARRRAEKFAEKELTDRVEVAVDESLKKLGL